jgi:hypothetical protein
LCLEHYACLKIEGRIAWDELYIALALLPRK